MATAHNTKMYHNDVDHTMLIYKKKWYMQILFKQVIKHTEYTMYLS